MPIAGEPTNFEPNGVSPSDAAQTLAAAWPDSEGLSLRGVQARIPKSVHEMDEGKIARDLTAFWGVRVDIGEIFEVGRKAQLAQE